MVTKKETAKILNSTERNSTLLYSTRLRRLYRATSDSSMHHRDEFVRDESGCGSVCVSTPLIRHFQPPVGPSPIGGGV